QGFESPQLHPFVNDWRCSGRLPAFSRDSGVRHDIHRLALGSWFKYVSPGHSSDAMRRTSIALAHVKAFAATFAARVVSMVRTTCLIRATAGPATLSESTPRPRSNWAATGSVAISP